MRAIGIALLLVLGASAVWYRLRPLALDLTPVSVAPVCEFRDGRPVVTMPGGALVARVATFDDELYAYFNFDYLGGREAVRPANLLLTHDGAAYHLFIEPENNLITALPFLASLRRQGYIPGYEWGWVSHEHLQRLRDQTRLLRSVYSLPVRQSLEGFTPAQRRNYVHRFVLFKSRTDPRIRRGVQPVPPTLTEEQAERLTDDILTVADFFWLPLDLFLGIGAMENNYMDVPGDLQHAIWKDRPEPDDIVLRRANGRVLVRNNANGVWQITRETLRQAHRLYLKNDWDYSLLPAHLRPPLQLDLNQVESAHLTTYAGLLFRELIDRFQGDVARAVGAYNGGPGRPNMEYEKGVRMVANYARRILEQAVRFDETPAAHTSFIAPAR